MIETNIGNKKGIRPTIKRIDSLENVGAFCADFVKDIIPSQHDLFELWFGAQRTALSGLADRSWKAASTTILCGFIKSRQRYLQPKGQVRFSAWLGSFFYFTNFS
jgi:hypothetical protein